MKLVAHPDAIEGYIQQQYMSARAGIESAVRYAGHGWNAIARYQAYVLFAWVQPYNIKGATILEIGTLIGFSAAVMAEAAPLAKIVTLNPNGREADQARRSLARYQNVTVRTVKSWDYLEKDDGWYDVVFVDGDHNRIALDLPWWDRVKSGGLMAFHDYSPAGVLKPCPPVYDALNQWARDEGNDRPDTYVIGSEGDGMAGFYK